MPPSVTLTSDCSITIPVYGAKSFAAGESVTQLSPYYFPLINAGYTNAALSPSFRQPNLVGNMVGGQSIRWNSTHNWFEAYDPQSVVPNVVDPNSIELSFDPVLVFENGLV